MSDRDELWPFVALLLLADSPDDTLLITSRRRTTLRAYASTAAWGSLPAVSSLTASCARESAATRARREEGRVPNCRGGDRGELGDMAVAGEGLPTAELPDE